MLLCVHASSAGEARVKLAGASGYWRTSGPSGVFVVFCADITADKMLGRATVCIGCLYDHIPALVGAGCSVYPNTTTLQLRSQRGTYFCVPSSISASANDAKAPVSAALRRTAADLEWEW